MKNRNNLLVSVIMPVYNAGNFLPEAIESILGQTYKNFEFIIVDDGSTDNSLAIIKGYGRKDKRIKVFKNKRNLGVSATANFAISKSKGKFLARMDADDISIPDRLEKQVEFLLKRKEIVAVGGQCVVIDKNGDIIGEKRFPLKSNQLKEMIFWAAPIQQPTIMINKGKLPKAFVWYSPKCKSAEELDVLFRLLKYGKLANLADWVLQYRYLPNSLSHKDPKKTFFLTLKSRVSAVKSGYKPSFKGIVLTIAQTGVCLVLPNSAINTIWTFLRGTKKTAISSPASFGLALSSIDQVE